MERIEFKDQKIAVFGGTPISVRSLAFTPNYEGVQVPCTYDGTPGSCYLCDEYMLRVLRPLTFNLEMTIENVSRRLIELLAGRRLPCPSMKKWRQKKGRCW